MQQSTLKRHCERMQSACLESPEVPWPIRADRLQRLSLLIQTNSGDIAQAINQDFGHRSRHETALFEIVPSLSSIRHALKHGRQWMKTARRPTGLWFLPGSSRVMPQPLGVAGIIVPWNYPLYLAAGPLVAAFVAGNRVMLKLSEWTPVFSALMEQLVARQFAPDELIVVNGDAGVATEFSTLPFDHLLFTGSTSVGRQVMRAAAANLTPVTLELGGKSPAIIAPGYSIERAAARILVGKCLNAGQTCIAPDYVLLPEGFEQEFIAAARACVAKMYPDILASPDYASIINARHFDRIAGLLDEAKAMGATVENLSPRRESPDAVTRRHPPFVLTGVTDGMRVMQDEIFGPLLPIVPYPNIEAAIAWVNARPKPLALYLFDDDSARIERVLAKTRSGGVTVNDTILHVAQDDLPFGGVGPSGMGQYHGHEGFLTFSKLKPVFRQSRWNSMALFNPPYGKFASQMIDWLKRWA
jgi:acyl-CoA reductase-like NAD-dependent aldehyde dehydrogenase